MIKRMLCREYIEEIERLERSIVELEEEIVRLKTQLRMKTNEATSLAIENANLRHKLERLQRQYERLIEFLKNAKIPFVIIDEECEEETEGR
ncbi:hypothetical protein [Pyrococcus yayanosii]|uniref:Uncharacterized protein n=1 Tax=Pyrococcus yayanosii (strain CH1 / JCM 16557) TaxID=529709 RepID=F8AFQ9_PYRYC|nr:hypothetical protein [Pyrococcus yayanosii]AEH25036.1 hypothetical protein PYCH_13660 [Pyrococcus yayanosii CH1]